MSECDRCGKHGETRHVILPDAEYRLCGECATKVRNHHAKRHKTNSITFTGP